MTKKDIKTEQDIVLMVNSFYEKVNLDPLLSPIFNDFAQVDWDMHLPKMYRFWGKMLLGISDYNGYPFQPHIRLPIDGVHFGKWAEIFVENIDAHFEGENAEMAKQRAMSIAQLFQNKLAFMRQYNPAPHFESV